MSRRRLVAIGLFVVLVAVGAALVLWPDGGGPELAGSVGPNGGVVVGGRELASTPGELYASQAEGEVAVVDRLPPDFNLGAERRGSHVCLRLHPAGRPPTSENCRAAAYRDHDDVERTTFLYEGTATTRQGRRRRVLYGFTHLAAVQVLLDDHAQAADLTTTEPFWMTQFFALPADDGQRAIELVDADGKVVARVALGD